MENSRPFTTDFRRVLNLMLFIKDYDYVLYGSA